MNEFRLPGVVWSALLIALPLLAAWLEQYFPGAVWAAPIAGLLLIVAKVVEVVRAESAGPALPQADGARDSGSPPMHELRVGGPSAVQRLFWG